MLLMIGKTLLRLYDQLAPLELRQAFLAAIDRSLRRSDPFDQLGHSRLERAPRLEAEHALDLGDVGKAVPDVADAILVHDLGGDVLAQQARQHSGYLRDGDRLSAADIEGIPDALVAIEHHRKGLGDVLNVDEVASLLAILEDQRRLIIEQARNENRRHARIGVAQRLARPIGVEQPKRHGWNFEGASDGQEHLLVIALVHRVDRGWLEGLVLARRQWRQLLVAIDEFPMPVGKLFTRAQPWKHRRAAGLAGVRTFSVDRHRRGDHDPLDRVRLARQRLQHDRCGHDIVARVVDDVGHALTDAHRSGQMSQVGYALDALFEHAFVEKIAFDALCARVEIDRPPVVIEFGVAVNLRRQAVEHRHFVSPRQQGIDQVRTDESRATGYQSMLVHSATPRATSTQSRLRTATSSLPRTLRRCPTAAWAGSRTGRPTLWTTNPSPTNAS